MIKTIQPKILWKIITLRMSIIRRLTKTSSPKAEAIVEAVVSLGDVAVVVKIQEAVHTTTVQLLPRSMVLPSPVAVVVPSE